MLGWNSFANLLYVDQPGETGFTYFTKPVRTLLLCMDMIVINVRCNIVNKLHSRLCIRWYTGIFEWLLIFYSMSGPVCVQRRTDFTWAVDLHAYVLRALSSVCQPGPLCVWRKLRLVNLEWFFSAGFICKLPVFHNLYEQPFTQDNYENYEITFCSDTAGHYVPAVGRAILESNSIYSKNLKGIG